MNINRYEIRQSDNNEDLAAIPGGKNQEYAISLDSSSIKTNEVIAAVREKRLNAKELEENFSYTSLRSHNVFRSGFKYMKKYYKPSPKCMKNFFFLRFPFFGWILKYNIKEALLADLIAGLTVGVVHIPQNMAYALMAGVPAINGLYVQITFLRY